MEVFSNIGLSERVMYECESILLSGCVEKLRREEIGAFAKLTRRWLGVYIPASSHFRKTTRQDWEGYHRPEVMRPES
jgi:hypothetical protein